MVTLQEVVERSFYIALLHETLKRGLTINPDDYLIDGDNGLRIPTQELYQKYLRDKNTIEETLKNSGSSFYYVFGIGNNQERGKKDLPRITLELKAWYPGTIGVEKEDLELNSDNVYQAVEYDYETKDTLIDVHLCANTQDEMRILHNIMYKALPARGYLKPYLNNYEDWKSQKIQPSGNLFIEVGNYYDHPDLQHGFLEKVYTYTVYDGLLMEELTDVTYSPITDISCLLKLDNNSDSDNLNINIKL